MRHWYSWTSLRAAVIASLIAQAGGTVPLHAQGAVDNVASQLICQCGCGKLLNVCEMDTAKEMKAIIGQKLSDGLNAKEVIDYMTATYGEQVLAAPTKRGFNLTAWITPFAAILVGSLVIWLAVATWTQRRRLEQAADIALVAEHDLESKYGAILEHELDEFEV
ncbi:MAG: cytochrome c-type biogenesis protein CcmH [Gemmatimonadales bacterium]